MAGVVRFLLSGAGDIRQRQGLLPDGRLSAALTLPDCMLGRGFVVPHLHQACAFRVCPLEFVKGAWRTWSLPWIGA
jgi:hypothetical protein